MTSTPETRPWTTEELTAIADSDDFHVAVYYGDGRLGTLTWIWSVVMDGEVYIRSYSGTDGKWYGSMVEQRAGRVTAGGGDYEVAFDTVDHPTVLNDVDVAYHDKYGSSLYIEPMVSDRAREATALVRPAA